ncbi:MAG: hypothetical protein HC849_01135 [Oscillatoriales cyanobacterium RU_3_3]|nr:hypothetical protein [Microcoleus sp. SM1_3_4]NJM59107.1 hypothetical protein [Oscillatoriales cyanobacterium RU_3_3]
MAVASADSGREGDRLDCKIIANYLQLVVKSVLAVSSEVRCPQSAVRSQQSVVINQLSTVNYQLSTIP